MARTCPWKVSDELWERVSPLIPSRPPKPKGGRPPEDDRQMFEAILFVLRTGIQWNALPRTIGASTTVYDRFCLWMAGGFFHALWEAGLTEFYEVIGIDWQWQSLDGVMTKAPLGGRATGANPTDRGKRGTKRSQLSDGHGLPIALVIDGANVHDTNLVAVTLDAIILQRPTPTEQKPQHLCPDAGYVGERTENAVTGRGSIPPVRPRGEDRGNSGSSDAKKRPRRFRSGTLPFVAEPLAAVADTALEKLPATYEAFLHLACALICSQRCDHMRISHLAAQALSKEARPC